MHRRWYNGGQGWNLANEQVWGLSGFHWNTPISIAAWVMGLAQIPFSIKRGKKATDNPWEATTLEYTALPRPLTATSSPRHSFTAVPPTTASPAGSAILRCKAIRFAKVNAQFQGRKLPSISRKHSAISIVKCVIEASVMRFSLRECARATRLHGAGSAKAPPSFPLHHRATPGRMPALFPDVLHAHKPFRNRVLLPPFFEAS